jgi:hypothetical protein
MHLSPSSFSKLRSCEYLWFANSVLRIEARGRSRHYLDRGNLFHALIEKALRIYVDTGKPFVYEGADGFVVARSVFTEQYKKRGIECEEADALELLEAARWQLPRLRMEEWEVLHVETTNEAGVRVRVPLIECMLSAPWGDHELHAILDLVFCHKTTGKIWHVNWKTSAMDLKPITHVVNDYQLFIEREILRHHGIKVDVSALCFLRSVPPTPPPLTYNGTKVSRDKSKVACTWELYVKTVESIGGDPHEYEEMQPVLDARIFSRWCPDATTETADAVMRAELTEWLDRAETIKFAWDNRASFGVDSLLDSHEYDMNPKRKLGHSCLKCDYLTWCRAGLDHPDGMDLRLLGPDYKLRDNKSPLVGIRLNRDGPTYDPNLAYKLFAAKHGRTIEPHQEFSP